MNAPSAAVDPVHSASALALKRAPQATDLGPMLSQFTARHEIPGVGAAVLHNGYVVAEGVAGVRRQGSSIPVKQDDQFEIASGAKAMSATAIASLVEEGKLNWDAPVSRYFQEKTFSRIGRKSR